MLFSLTAMNFGCSGNGPFRRVTTGNNNNNNSNNSMILRFCVYLYNGDGRGKQQLRAIARLFSIRAAVEKGSVD